MCKALIGSRRGWKWTVIHHSVLLPLREMGLGGRPDDPAKPWMFLTAAQKAERRAAEAAAQKERERLAAEEQARRGPTLTNSG